MVAGVILLHKTTRMGTTEQVTKPQTTKPVNIIDTEAECKTDSEKTYRAYLDANAQKKDNGYGILVYDLPREEWDKINKQRAEEHSKCFNKFN